MASRAAKARAAAAALRDSRAKGVGARLANYKFEEHEDLYEEVDEEGYKKVIRARLDQSDFVIDDNGAGYADDGREDWGRDDRVYSESEEELPLKGKPSKRKREEDRERKEQQTNGINKYFSAGTAAIASKPKPITTAEDEAFMTSLLGEVENNATVERIPSTRRMKRSEARPKTRLLSPPIENMKRPAAKRVRLDDGYLPETPPAEPKFEDDENLMLGMDDDALGSDLPLPSSPVVKAVQRRAQAKEESDEEDVMEVTQAVGHSGKNIASVNLSGARPAPKIKKPAYPSPESSSPTRPAPEAINASAWNDVTAKLNIMSSPAPETSSFGKLQPQNAVEEDNSLRFFWTDYTEVNGSLCLFGKVKDKSSGNYVSAFVKVDNILRKLYFLPRERRYRNGRETDEEVGMEDVYSEVDALMTRLKVGMHKIKPCERKYAFEKQDVPRQADYLKLLYSYEKSQLPTDLQGETFSHIFGSNTALFEQFVLWRNIMGPCWLKIEGADFKAVNNSSWCKLELQVSKPSLITPLGDSENLDAPDLTLMSISLRTKLNVKENKQEILAISARIYQKISLSDTTAAEKLPCQTFTVIRPSEKAFPFGFEALASKHHGYIRTEKSEQGLLSSFLAKIQHVDPDVLVGHQLEGVDYSILLSRLRENKTPQWHRIGRMKRNDWPKNMGRAEASFFAERQLVSGRLMCDLANDLGKSLMTKCQSWSLTEMSELVLGSESLRKEIDNEAALKSWATSKEGLMNYVSHCEADTYFIAAIALKIQMLPLTKVLTNLAGNSWARTLGGTRAERNEYILLHEFYRNKYICPDKVWGKGKLQKAVEDRAEGEEGTDIKKKDKYKGGLVFEPEKGLYDKFILVMDFNSLYPSIIQEFNICFTTVERIDLGEDEEKVPEVPVDQKQGILPKLIATLVQRRRQVKGLMKDKSATPDQLATWDIKQLALKLTANSMYGCLGYTRSRFYARPLAMLTTFKGREILRSTKELAESTSLRVIYGDTDSVMINTNVDNIEDAMKVGRDFKRAVNDRYKLLEIDIDNIFRRLLLHAKKKYAAINMMEIDGKYVDKLEVKGLDMKRREYCALSKEASSKLLNEILSGEESEVVIQRVHDYLRDLSETMRDGKQPTQKYIIYTKLGKNPKEYPNADSMPQVQVALRELSRGKTVRSNDVMSYVVTGDSNSSIPPAKRAYTPQDVLKADSGLKPDVEWYLIKQIFPPVERLCAPIDGTDAMRLAECLGLDAKKYAINTGGNSKDQTEIFPLESQIPEEVRFKDAARLSIRCRACRESFLFEGIATSPSACSNNGLVCPKDGCGKTVSMISLIAQLEAQIRLQTSEYYAGYLVCDDPSCGARTRQMSVYGHRCLGPKGLGKECLGRMSYEYSEKKMYNQLLYFASLWNVENAKEKASKEEREKVGILAEYNRKRFENPRKVVDGYLKKCGRVWVQMDSLFGFAAKSA